MTYIGIDFGSKRVGVAVSDPENRMAFPVKVLRNDPKLIDQLIKISKEKNSNQIILGESKDYKGEDNEIMESVEEFKKELEDMGYVVEFEPEFMTSLQATRIQGENNMIDAAAATILLQSYLDKQASRVGDGELPEDPNCSSE